MSRLGFMPDFYFNEPLTALSTPGGPGPLGLTVVDPNPMYPPQLSGCVGCGVPGRFAGPVAEAHRGLGWVIPDESPLGLTTGNLAAIGIVLGAVAGIGAGFLAMRKRRRR